VKQSVFTGAFRGVVGWLIYGVTEFLLAYTIPRFWKPGLEIAEWQRGPILLVMGIYALIGLLFGGAGGAVLAWVGKNQRGNYALLVSLSVTTMFAGNVLAAWPLARSEQVALATAIGLIAIFLAALVLDSWQRRAALFARPWALSLLLLAGPWVSREALQDHSMVVKTWMSLLAMAAVVALAAIWSRIVPENAATPRRKAVAAAAIVALVWISVQTTGAMRAQGAGKPAVSTAQGSPNIVLITMDTVRADHLSVYGYERQTTPQLQEFAREANVYDHAMAAADYTLPAHASIFTGLYPSWHGAYPLPPDYAGGRPLTPRTTTLAKLLSANGYWTGGIVANAAFLHPGTGLAQGFAVWESGMPVPLADGQRPFYLREQARRLLNTAVPTSEFDALFLRASDINRRAFKTIEKLRHGGPFFLFLNYMDAHFPYNAPPPYRDRFARMRPNTGATVEYNELKNAVNAGRRQIRNPEKSLLMAQYDSGIAFLDSEIGKLLARMRDLGVYENTLIIITADHGEAFGDHDVIGHTVTSVYQDGVHIPLLVKYPGQHLGQRSGVLVSHVDLMPTVLDAAGCPLPNNFHGKSLRLPRSDSDVVFSEARAIGDHAKTARLGGTRRAIFSSSVKLITWTAGPPEFYDLVADPNESANRYESTDPVVASLMTRLSAWTSAIPRQLPNPAMLDRSAMERIKSLGYVQ
jgi:arylsulfatase A-like enzyme